MTAVDDTSAVWATPQQAGVTLSAPPDMTHCDLAVESRLKELRHALLMHHIVVRRVKQLARLRIDARHSMRAHAVYLHALVRTEHELDGHIAADELDYFARVWWSRRRLRVWGLSIPVGGLPRYGRTGQRARGGVDARTVSLAVEAIAARMDRSYAIADGDYMDPSAPRVARGRLRKLTRPDVSRAGAPAQA
jgi:hypothetical protein